jgi:hypothetical protein
MATNSIAWPLAQSAPFWCYCHYTYMRWHRPFELFQLIRHNVHAEQSEDGMHMGVLLGKWPMADCYILNTDHDSVL